jgi:hypothetical protein
MAVHIHRNTPGFALLLEFLENPWNFENVLYRGKLI